MFFFRGDGDDSRSKFQNWNVFISMSLSMASGSYPCLLKITSYTSWSHRNDRLLVFPSQKWSEMNWNWAKADGFVGYISTKREERNKGKYGISPTKRDDVFYKNVTIMLCKQRREDREIRCNWEIIIEASIWIEQGEQIDRAKRARTRANYKQTRARRSLTFDFTTARWMMPGLEGKTCRRSNYYDLW